MNSLTAILKDIKQQIGWSPKAEDARQIGGGCISSAYLFSSDIGHKLFLKTHHASQLFMFEAEAAGLVALHHAAYPNPSSNSSHRDGQNALKIPQVFCTGIAENNAYIAMQAIDFAPAKAYSYRLFGEQLANLHRNQNKQFGGGINNTIGNTPQNNPSNNNWYDFWRKHRLGAQLTLAQQNGANSDLLDLGYQLGEKMEALFTKTPRASCLHGDLWQGNWGFSESGSPVIFDPAHYYGDRETDLAMMKLFGQAPPDFYAAYHDHYPIKPDYQARETFYNLYHILNHFNLFGGAYQQQAKQMMQQLLSELN